MGLLERDGDVRRVARVAGALWITQWVPSMVFAIGYRVFTDFGYKVVPVGIAALVQPSWMVGCVVFALAWSVLSRRSGAAAHVRAAAVAVVAYTVVGVCLGAAFGGPWHSGVLAELTYALFPGGQVSAAMLWAALLVGRRAGSRGPATDPPRADSVEVAPTEGLSLTAAK